MFGSAHTSTPLGVNAIPVEIEASIATGLPTFTIVGMHVNDARECKERIRCGLAAAGVQLPLKRVTVNLAPADIPKRGAGFDLPIAIAIIRAMGLISAASDEDVASFAEIGLDGELRSVPGAMAVALASARSGRTGFVTAQDGAGRAAHARLPVFGLTSLSAVVKALRTGKVEGAPTISAAPVDSPAQSAGEMSDIRGQDGALAAAEIAAAGGHHIIFHGPPGCGKTMLASRFATMLPPLDGDDLVEVNVLRDVAGISTNMDNARPVRAPHHTVTQTALIGGGSASAVVGEVSLAHKGILFLDELPEFRPSALDALRQPLEQREVVVNRAQWSARFPADAQVVAAMNLCRCGRAGARRGSPCSCTATEVKRYRQRVSGAIMNRFDIAVRMDEPSRSLEELPRAPKSAVFRAKIAEAQERQHQRLGPGLLNASVRAPTLAAMNVDPSAAASMDRAAQSNAISGRAQASVLRVARTIADLDGSDRVKQPHMLIAITSRPLVATSGE